jgi:hypothetical protein
MWLFCVPALAAAYRLCRVVREAKSDKRLADRLRKGE